MNDDHRELWQAVDNLRERNGALESRMSAHEATQEAFLMEFRESRRERKEQIDTIAHAIESRLSDFDGKFDTLSEKVTEAHGAAKFGKWLIGIVLAAAGLIYTRGS